MPIIARKLDYFLPWPYRAGQRREKLRVAKKYIANFFCLPILRREARQPAQPRVRSIRCYGEATQTTSIPGGFPVKKLIALLIGVAFVAGVSGSALAQTTTAPKEEKKMEKPAAAPAEKKPAAHNASGMVKTAAADSIVVTGKTKGKDAEWTFSVDPKTKIRKGNKDITAADLAAGDNVSVRYHEEIGRAHA